MEEFRDNDVSATKDKPRPQFTEMMKRVDAGEFDIVISRHMDRLLRKLSEFVDVRDRCEASDTYIITAADGVDTSTPAGRMIAGILAVVAEGEMTRKSERQISAVLQAVLAGKWLGGPRAFGYESDGITVKEGEAALMREAYIDILAGETLSAITRKWNDACLTPRGKQWTRASVRAVLTNPRNAGLRRHRSQAERGARDPQIGIVGKAVWKGVVDVPMWNAAVRVLADPTKQRSAGVKGLLSGVAVCGVCGDLVGRGTARRGKPTYRCRGVGHFQQISEPIDKHIEQLTLGRLTAPDAALLWQAERPDASALMAEANDLREELKALDEDRAEGRLDRVRWRAMNERVASRLGVIEEQISRASDNSPLAIVASGNVRATWEGLSTNRRRAIIATLMTPVIRPAGAGARKFRAETVDPGWKK